MGSPESVRVPAGSNDRPGVRLKRPAANSSTMRGGKGAERPRHRLPVILVGDDAELRIVFADQGKRELVGSTL